MTGLLDNCVYIQSLPLYSFYTCRKKYKQLTNISQNTSGANESELFSCAFIVHFIVLYQSENNRHGGGGEWMTKTNEAHHALLLHVTVLR